MVMKVPKSKNVQLCQGDEVVISQARFRRRSTHVPNQIELGSTLERHWRDN